MNKLDKKYHDMDVVVSKLLKEVLDNIEKQDEIIMFEGFNIKNKSHLLILNMLFIARSLTKKPIKIKASRWTIYRINKLYKKDFDKVLKANKQEVSNIYLTNLTTLGAVECINSFDNAFNLDDIYDEYYNPERKKELK